MQFMGNILLDQDIPLDSCVSIEYAIPLTSKRIDFIVSGQTEERLDAAVIVELKQWSEVSVTQKDGVVITRLGGSSVETNHPSYQAWSYATLIEDFNEKVRQDSIRLVPCAYLHNLDSREAINDPFYAAYVQRAPVFISHDARALARFIKKHIRYGDSKDVMYRIEHGKIKPSKALADVLVSMLNGNKEFLMIDDQKLVYEAALDLAHRASEGKKQVLIVQGGPGTGKTVVAINLLVELTAREIAAHYVSKNQAVRDVYAAKLSGHFRSSRIRNLFRGSGQFIDSEADVFGALIIDEAHRLNEKSGLYANLGENQIKELIKAARFSVFFLDEDQRVTFLDIGDKEEIRKWALGEKAEVTEMSLASQFRCNGSDGYLAWIDDVLGVRETANQTLESAEYDFRVFEDPNVLRQEIERLNRGNNKARLVAGYCWDWVSKRDPEAMDIVFPEYDFQAQWNLQRYGMTWLIDPTSVKEIGCIHTCQGLELDYVGVIIGPDLLVRDGVIITNPDKRSRYDKSVRGYKKLLRSDSLRAQALGGLIIKNTYRTLMTRGQKGCYVFSPDQETRDYFQSRLSKPLEDSPIILPTTFSGLHLELLPAKQVRPYVNAVPIFDLKFAAGGFGLPQNAQEAEWVSLPDHLKIREGYFVAQVFGSSMNRVIPDGAWCLFRINPQGSRNGKIVVVESRAIDDPETGGRYTVKRYFSEKANTESSLAGFRQTKIVLRPDSSDASHKEIILLPDLEGDVRVVAEFLSVVE